MIRLIPLFGAIAGSLLIGACASGIGGGSPDVRTVAVRTDAEAADVAVALNAVGPRAVFLASERDEAWFEAVAGAANLTLSGPGRMEGGLRMGFLGPEPVGDTTLTLRYDQGRLTLHDALYELSDERLLDLIAFRIDGDEPVRPAIGALLEYVATDVSNAAALVMAVVVPNAAVGDSVARMLSPAYFDALRCEPGAAPRSDRDQLRLFYGPAARMYCEDVAVEDRDVGEWIEAELVLGRR